MHTKTAPSAGVALVAIGLTALGLVGLGAVSSARAFCGFYVGSAGADLYSNATRVVLLREGTRTVLSMQNDYEGPVEDFALVVPVPTVLREGDVHTLPSALFDHVDQLTAPRLVEYWEQDPCPSRSDGVSIDDLLEGALAGPRRRPSGGGGGGGGGRASVRVEAQFVVGEYEVVILSADESVALERWLDDEGYRIPRGAHEALRPYVESGMKFFVARVDPARVRFENGRAVLSPLRVEYEAAELALPIRLGRLSSQGTQDLLVHVLSPEGRFEVANRPNTTIPTNVRVLPRTAGDFGPFYERMFERAIREAPGAVVTEYAWSSGSCDPCPTPALGPHEIVTLGARPISAHGYSTLPDYTLTRLHYRYTAADATTDLVFRHAPSLEGGVGVPDVSGQLERRPRRASSFRASTFQGRYVILHRWEGPVACEAPRRGVWGGPHRGAPRVVGTRSQAMLLGRAAIAGSVRRGGGSGPGRRTTARPREPALPGPGRARPILRRAP